MIFETKKKNRLQYNSWGNLKASQVILFFHGFPGSHVQARSLEKHLKKFDIGLIAVDRPGYGQSTFTKPGDYKSHLEGILELLSGLEVQKFSVLGVSGGSPLAHVMAASYPDRIQNLIIVCGMTPFDKEGKKLYSEYQRRVLSVRKWIPNPMIRRLTNSVLKYYGPEKKLQRFMTFLNESDKKSLMLNENRMVIFQSMIEARRQQSSGIVWDSALYAQNWLQNCDIESFKKFPVQYYHGKQDNVLSYQMSDHMKKLIPHSKLTLFEEEGHYSLAFDRAEEILLSIK